MGLDNPIHLMFLLVVLLLVFGAKRLPELGHSLGTGLRGFKDAIGGEGVPTSLSSLTQTQPVTPPATVQQPAQPATAQPVPVAAPVAQPAASLSSVQPSVAAISESDDHAA